MPKRDPEHMNAQRERIIQATLACIARKGVEKSSIADIWKEAGLSAGALYVHFKNKSDLITQCLRYSRTQLDEPPATWDALKARLLEFETGIGSDATTVARIRVNLHAEAMNSEELHDILRPILEEQFVILTEWIDALARSGSIALRMSARQTAAAISAQIDGMLWIALASDRPLDEALREIAQVLDCFVVLSPDRDLAERLDA